MKSAAFFLFCLLSTFTLCLARPSQNGNPASAPPDQEAGRHLVLKGVRVFGEVTPMLYRGGQTTPEGFERLTKLGIDIVVDVERSKHEKKLVERLGMRYVSIPWLCPFPKDKVFVRFLKLIKDNPDKKIFVHCHLGDDRTGMMVASYRMALQGWTAQQAMIEMRSFGFKPFHHVMCPGLARYEKSFPERLRKNRAFQSIR